ncbi:hypothetical protein GOP47_0027390 [Adiantum capillus-veneris]|nr:hypothetical protein GOP47_0027390 [Adiantum capillus-veneris]
MACTATRFIFPVGTIVFLVFCVISSIPAAAALQHDVGGAAGWTLPSRANLTYQEWESGQSFVVADTLFFKYDANRHNVMVVTEEDYVSCNYSHPLAMYDDGMTLLEVDEPGTYFFICGVPGHCKAGQKLEVTAVQATAEAPAPSPNVPSISMPPSVSPASSPSAGPPAPAPSGAPSPAPSAPSQPSSTPIPAAPSPAPLRSTPISAAPSPAPLRSIPPAASPAYAPSKDPLPISPAPSPSSTFLGFDTDSAAPMNLLRRDAIVAALLAPLFAIFL